MMLAVVRLVTVGILVTCSVSAWSVVSASVSEPCYSRMLGAPVVTTALFQCSLVAEFSQLSDFTMPGQAVLQYFIPLKMKY